MWHASAAASVVSVLSVTDGGESMRKLCTVSRRCRHSWEGLGLSGGGQKAAGAVWDNQPRRAALDGSVCSGDGRAADWWKVAGPSQTAALPMTLPSCERSESVPARRVRAASLTRWAGSAARLRLAAVGADPGAGMTMNRVIHQLDEWLHCRLCATPASVASAGSPATASYSRRQE